jgi:hypothetical protein
MFAQEPESLFQPTVPVTGDTDISRVERSPAARTACRFIERLAAGASVAGTRYGLIAGVLV